MSDKFSVEIDAHEVIQKMTELDKRTQIALNEVAHIVSKQMETYAKENASWIDRTGDARDGLEGNSEWKGTTLDISIKHTVDYGLWLEIAHHERFAILQNARDSQVELFKMMLKEMKL